MVMSTPIGMHCLLLHRSLLPTTVPGSQLTPGDKNVEICCDKKFRARADVS